MTATTAGFLMVGICLGGGAPAQAAEVISDNDTGVSQAVVRAPLATGSAERDRFEAKVVRLTNRARAKARRCGRTRMKATKKVRWDPQLGTSAHMHSADMATKDYFSHFTPSGTSPFERIRSAGYDYRAAGENIAAGPALATPRKVVKAWLRSPAHCRVLMDPLYRDLGVGRVEGPGSWHIYWTQNFGRRR